MDEDPRPLLAAWSAWTHEHSAEILADPLLHALAHLSRRALGEANAAAARATAAADAASGHAVLYATEAQARAIASLTAPPPADPPGTILRATDTGREWVLLAEPSPHWRPR
jgi:hypothetical protein